MLVRGGTQCVLVRGGTQCVLVRGGTQCVLVRGGTQCVLVRGATQCVLGRGGIESAAGISLLTVTWCQLVESCSLVCKCLKLTPPLYPCNSDQGTFTDKLTALFTKSGSFLPPAGTAFRGCSSGITTSSATVF